MSSEVCFRKLITLAVWSVDFKGARGQRETSKETAAKQSQSLDYDDSGSGNGGLWVYSGSRYDRIY